MMHYAYLLSYVCIALQKENCLYHSVMYQKTMQKSTSTEYYAHMFCQRISHPFITRPILRLDVQTLSLALKVA